MAQVLCVHNPVSQALLHAWSYINASERPVLCIGSICWPGQVSVRSYFPLGELPCRTQPVDCKD